MSVLNIRNVVVFTSLVIFFYSFGVATLALENIIIRQFIILFSALYFFLLIIYCFFLNKLVLPSFIFMIIFLNSIFVGLLNGAEFKYFALDFSIVLSVSISIFYARYSSISDLKLLFYSVSFFTSCLYIFYIIKEPLVFDITTVLLRGLTWDDGFYLATAFYLATYVFAYVLIYKSRNLIYYIYILLFLFSSFIVLKRAAVIQLSLVLLFYIILEGGLRQRFYYSVILGVISLLLLYIPNLDFLLPVIVAVQERFSDISNEGIGNFNRVQEFFIYYSSQDWERILFGAGLGVPHSALDVENLAMHIGFFNFIFKFGILPSILFLLLIFYTLFVAIIKYKYSNIDMRFYIICFLSSLIPFFTFLNFWDVLPALFLFFVFMFKIIIFNSLCNAKYD